MLHDKNHPISWSCIQKLIVLDWGTNKTTPLNVKSIHMQKIINHYYDFE